MTSKVLLILLAFNAIIPLSMAQSPIVGVLEDVPGGYVGQPNHREVRVVFHKMSHDWIAFPSNCPNQACLKTVTLKFPRKVIWNIGFDGKLLGKVTGRTPREFQSYSDVGLQEINGNVPIPTVGKRSVEFGGDSDASVYRPLIADSEPYISDPDGWKPFQPVPAETQLFRRQFRQKFPKLCKSSEDETRLEPFPYRDQSIQVIKAYASRKDWKIARLHLDGAVACNDVEGGFQIDDPWFALDAQGQFHYLGSGMWLVDTGDYDNGGSSELLFSIDRNNRGGYVLFYNDFRNRAVFQFSYH